MLNSNDDMDDKIRKAAEEYPLKIEGKDWDKVAGAMQSTAEIEEPGNRKEYWWLLLLLLPLMVAIPYLYKNNSTQKPVTYSNTKKTEEATEKQNGGGSLHKNDEPLLKDNKTTEQVASGRNPGQQMNEVAREEKQKESRLNKQFNAKTPAVIGNESSISANDFNNGKENSERTGNNNIGSTTVTGRDLATGNSDINSTKNSKAQAASSGLVASGQDNKGKSDNGNSLTADSSKMNKEVLKPQQESAASTKKMDNKHTTPIKTKGLYIGIAAGLDISTVKFNEVNKIGHTIAMVAGYRLNNHWSIESGFMWDTKHYYSPGEYFDKSRTDIPQDDYIHFLNGTCKMIEVPLNVKYDFKSKKSSGFFVAAGLSSYFMKKENYEYHATYNGDYYVGHKEYKNSTNNLFSVVNINGGYQFIFKNNNSLRIEPYIKIPLSGLGIGNLPFGSAGISAAFTIPLH